MAIVQIFQTLAFVLRLENRLFFLVSSMALVKSDNDKELGGSTNLNNDTASPSDLDVQQVPNASRHIRLGECHQGESFEKQSLTGQVFFRCQLQNADLSSACGLLADSFAQSDLTNATLPKYLSFDDILDSISDAAKQAKTAFFSLLIFSLYCLLSVAKTTHLTLVDDAVEFRLPIINDNVALASFYLVAPILLLINFLWMNSYLQRAWSQIALLPLRFPNGLEVNTRLSQWLPLAMRIGQGNRSSTSDQSGRFFWLEFMLSFIALWTVVPFTVVVMFFAYLPRHDWIVSSVAAIVFASVIGFSVYFAIKAAETLSNPFAAPVLSKRIKRPFIAAIVVLLAVLALLLNVVVFGYRSIEHTPRPLLSMLQELAGGDPLPFDLDPPNYAEFVTKPSNWTDNISGAELTKVLDDTPQWDMSNRNLDRAEFTNLFLPKAKFENSRMRQFIAGSSTFVDANFRRAQLRGANLTGTDLKYADFFKADLRDVDFLRADLRSVDFKQADLRNAKFDCAKLQGANFEHADISGAEISYVGCGQLRFSADDVSAVFKNAYCSSDPLFEGEAFFDCPGAKDKSLEESKLPEGRDHLKGD